jgi:epoxyqueuosine reductase
MSDDERSESMSRIRELGVDVAGGADLRRLTELPPEIAADSAGLPKRFRYAVALGAQLNKLGKQASGTEADLFLENAALGIMSHLESKGHPAFIIRPEDEYDPVHRMGLLSLKMPANAAGLGWQGRSLLIVSPGYGPVHRWIAVLTNLALLPGRPVPNRCGDCRICVDKCPGGALRFVPFADHPDCREDVVDIRACKGDAGCKVCLLVCPWAGPQPSV